MQQLLDRILETARREKREYLLETESLTVTNAMGIAVPAHLFVRNAREVEMANLDILSGDEVVIKVVSPSIIHKAQLGGVATAAKNAAAIAAAVEMLERQLTGQNVVGYSLNELIAHEVSLGGELLLGMRWTNDFGPVVMFGPGGINANFISDNLREGRSIAIFSPLLGSAERIEAILQTKAITHLITGTLGGQSPSISLVTLRELLERFIALSTQLVARGIDQFEINPLVLTDTGPVALDALIRFGKRMVSTVPPKPLWKLKHLLQPRSLAVIGVSEKLNPGHIIVKNIIRQGFNHQHIHIVKPGMKSLEGCLCYPDVASLPDRMDLAVLSTDASQIPTLIDDIISARKAESLILISAGLGERSGSENYAYRMQKSLADARRTDWNGPLINGGNCLGIRSLPGQYDATFIPDYKLKYHAGDTVPLAFISQSGAFAAAVASRLWFLNPKYLISIGNQIDLTVGDYLAYLKDDTSVEIFACYVEGFRPEDGQTWLEAAAEITESGRVVLLYRAGRTSAGAEAAASHTASMAGAYEITRELAESAGVLVADSLDEFEDLTHLSCLLRQKAVEGLRIAAVSNAGFECVATADNLGSFCLPAFSEASNERLISLVKQCGLESIVEVRNPLDVTPVMSDEGFEEAIRTIMQDVNVDLGIIGCVPMTGALNTLPGGLCDGEDVKRQDSIAQRLGRLRSELAKAWVTVVHAGPLYDPMVRILEEKGVPTFRSVDRAVRVLERYCRWRCGQLPKTSFP